MPMSGRYGGYSPGGYSSYPSASSHIYTSTFTTYRSSNFGRAATPSLEEAKARPYGFSPVGTPATYKYLSRNEFYNPTQDMRAPVKTINTLDIDVHEDKNLERDHAIPGEIKRDTAANIAGAQKVIRLVTMRQKNNPYAVGAVGEGLTLGQRLAMKHWIEPKVKRKTPSPPPKYRKASQPIIKEEEVPKNDSDSESWTWETCSSSEEGPDVQIFPDDPAPKGKKEPYGKAGRSATTDLPLVSNDVYSTRRQSIDRWTRAIFDKPRDSKRLSLSSKGSSTFSSGTVEPPQVAPRVVMSTKTEVTPSLRVSSRPSKDESIVSPVQTTPVKVAELALPVRQAPSRSSLSTKSSGSGESPESTPRFARAYQPPCAKFSSDEDSDVEKPTYNRGWRKGQPPRSDVVVKLATKEKPVQDKSKPAKSYTSEAMLVIQNTQDHSKLTNKILTSTTFMSGSSSTKTETSISNSAPKMQVGASPENKVKALVEEQRACVAAVEIVGQLKKDIENMRTVEQIRTYLDKVDTKIKETLPDPLPQSSLTTEEPKNQSRKTSVETKEIATQVAEETIPVPQVVQMEPTQPMIIEKTGTDKEVLGSIKELVCDLVEQIPERAIENQISHSSSEEDTTGVPTMIEAKIQFEVRPPTVLNHVQDVAEAIDEMVTQVVAMETAILSHQSEAQVPPIKNDLMDQIKDQKINQEAVGPRLENLKQIGVLNSKLETKLESGIDVNVSLKSYGESHKDVKVSKKIAIDSAKNENTQSGKLDMQKLRVETIDVKTKFEAVKVRRDDPAEILPPEKILVQKTATSGLHQPQQQKPDVAKGKAEKHVVPKKKMKKKTDILETIDKTPQKIVGEESFPNVPLALENHDLKLTAVPKIMVNSDSARSSLTSNASNDSLMSSQLDRLPSPLRKLFEIRSKVAAGETYVPEEPKEKPKYWDNKPKETDPSSNPFRQMAEMREEAKKYQKKVKEDQEAFLKSSTAEPEEPWYKDESEEFQNQLKTHEHRPSDHHREESEKRTPEENMAIINLYGGIQFPEPALQTTPKKILKKIFTRKKRKLDNTLPSSQDEASTSGTEQSASGKALLGSHSQPSTIEESDSSEHEDTPPPVPSPPRGTTSMPRNDAPVKAKPKFRKYCVDDFNFLKVLGKGSFGKVILAELKGATSYYAVKCLKKDVVLEDDDIECTMIERKVLALGCKHPFLCHLFCTFQTNSHLFFVMEYLNGGDLMFHIQQSGRFDLERARFYGAEILLALKFLHRKGIVYRDLKLDNLLLDFEGHIRIADFGMCKLQIYLDKTADTFCGTPDYMAPEIIKGLHYTHCVDWWSFGVLLYEMLIGQSPFNGCDEDELFWSICNEQPYFPRFLSRETKHILQLLLEKDPSRRLGVSGCSAGNVCDQPFFKSIDFAKLERKELIPPYKPKLRHALDVSYFDEAFTQEVAKLTPVDEDFLASVNQQQFKGFSYTNPNYTVK
ncbi:uncharacterized protein LOC131877095 isoform X2 [Tigriopus californicus]|uniref:uncharacterized protein LOC131877095 isoform X2 n=1 Tax=Tigriopus californicus TaxID=6832 RepID=UPI0027DA5151|nr:uncharacterized protein LOC131877095 isoform X2 [Tigriopus californicus]